MTFRDKPTYLTTEVWRAMWVLARARTARAGENEPGVERHFTTVDETVDLLLRQVIKDKYPQLLEHQRRIDELEKKLIGELEEGEDDGP